MESGLGKFSEWTRVCTCAQALLGLQNKDMNPNWDCSGELPEHSQIKLKQSAWLLLNSLENATNKYIKNAISEAERAAASPLKPLEIAQSSVSAHTELVTDARLLNR
jgi:hypothetical protein